MGPSAVRCDTANTAVAVKNINLFNILIDNRYNYTVNIRFIGSHLRF